MMRDSGFTLIELLVALAIFALLALGGVALLRSAARTQAVVSHRIDRLTDLHKSSAAIAADLLQALPRPVRGGPAFMGDTTGFSLSRGGPLMHRISYRIVDGRLERVGRRHLDGAAPEPPSVLLTGIRGFMVRYHYRDQWRDRWNPIQPAALPDAVELTIDMPETGPVRQLFLTGPGR